MPKNFLIVCVVLFFGISHVQSQDENYNDLIFLIIDGDYEKALNKAEKFTNKEKTKRDPVPYLYMSMAQFEMSKREEFAEEYPRAFRDAIKNASKFARYDRESEYVAEFDNYLTELKLEIMREARYYYEAENWRRSVTYAKYISRIDPDNLSALLLRGVAEVKSKNEYQAKTTFEEADVALNGFSPGDLSSDELPQLRYTILEYAALQKEVGARERAEPYLTMGREVFAEDPEFANFISNF
jgi:hypothetical protein